MKDSKIIAKANDELRSSLPMLPAPNRLILSHAVSHLERDDIRSLIMEVKKQDVFKKDDDPYGEHDFGAFDFKGKKYFWKIDYYDDATFTYGAEQKDKVSGDCVRVLTLMQSSEY